jgi:hypothetical protein
MNNVNRPIRPNELSPIERFGKKIAAWFDKHVATIGPGVFAWLAVILLHSATIPSLLAVMVGLSDNMPPVEMVLLVWAGLAMLFMQAIVQRNVLQIVTIAVGFILQDVLLALIFFR